MSRLTPDGLVYTVTYQNSKGATFETPVGEVLMHVFSHGVYHRGQIALALRQAGAEPINTDYITFVREAPSFGRQPNLVMNETIRISITACQP